MHKIWKNISRKEAVLRSKSVLETISFVPAPEPDDEQQSDTGSGRPPAGVPTPKPKRQCKACKSLGISLSRIQHKIMEAICEKPDEEIRDRCERLRIPRSMECSGRRGLSTLGLIEHIGSLGNRRYFFAPTKSLGQRWRESHGLPKWPDHAGPLHSFMVTRSEQKFATAYRSAKFFRRRTGEPAGVRPDSLAIVTGQRSLRAAIQATVTNKPRAEAVNLLKLCGIGKAGRGQETPSAVDLVISMAVNKLVQKNIERAVRELNSGQIPDNLVLYNCEEHLLAASFDWSILIEKKMRLNDGTEKKTDW